MNTFAVAANRGAAARSAQCLSKAALVEQNRRFVRTGGVSAGNRIHGFHPAFFDRETGTIYIARFSDGRPAPMHLLDGLPAKLVVERLPSGHVAAVKRSVEAGFVKDGSFITREEAAAAVDG
ncbi:MAG: hypothetical protein ACREVH_00965 [Gammaproteobacteria bacterium]